MQSLYKCTYRLSLTEASIQSNCWTTSSNMYAFFQLFPIEHREPAVTTLFELVTAIFMSAFLNHQNNGVTNVALPDDFEPFHLSKPRYFYQHRGTRHGSAQGAL